jgi:hypothetical protein
MTPSRDSDYSDRWRVALPHATVAPHNIVASSDLLATMAERVARVLASPLDLVILEPPSELLLTGFTLSMLWHERSHPENVRRSYRVRGRLRGGKSVTGESNRGWSLMPVFGSTAPRTPST